MRQFIQSVIAGLTRNLKIMVNILNYPTLTSTNDTAKTFPNPTHGTVIMTDIQTAGRGRYGRKFFSPPDCGIYMSVILLPQQIQEHNLITPMAAVAVCKAIEALTDKRPQIKWVNDVFLNERKICGILTEAMEDRIVIGIGINFAMPPCGFPTEIAATAGALFDQPPLSPTRQQLAKEIANCILHHCAPRNDVLCEYKKRLLVLGRRVSVISVANSDVLYEATATDIDENGGLIVQKDSGEIVTLTAGEVSLKLQHSF